MRRLGVLGEPVPVVLGGGVLTAGHAQLMDEIERRLSDEAPNARPRVVRTPPVVGAALLGLDHVGAGAGVRRQLRESFSASGEPPRA
jgi:hypothetical protein